MLLASSTPAPVYWVEGLSAFLASLAFLLAAANKVIRRTVRDEIQQENVKQEAKIQTQIDIAVAPLNAELKHNGGSSMKDLTKQTSLDIKELSNRFLEHKITTELRLNKQDEQIHSQDEQIRAIQGQPEGIIRAMRSVPE